jgi:hypothetical protein
MPASSAGGLGRWAIGRPGFIAAEYGRQQACTPSAVPASPYATTPGFGAAPGRARGDARATPPPCLSPASMVGLRQQELKDTGGGFLTHFADPRDLYTPGPLSAGAGGGPRVAGGCGAGSSTPLSALRSIHKLQQLQRLRREGAQLVAAIDVEGGSGGAG